MPVKKMSLRFAWLTLGLICLASFVLMLNASQGDAAIMDELAHIPAGYGYVHNLDYRLNPEHPPIVKALAMLPVLFLNPEFPTQSTAWTTDINGQWNMGSQFLYDSGNDPSQIVQLARLAPMLLTLLLIIFIYIWSSELLGEWWALLPSFLFALSPTVLAHGHYVTTDVGAAFGVIFATYYFVKFLFNPSRKFLIYAGLAFGVAEAMKFSTALLVPYFIFLVVVFCLVRIIRRWPETTGSHFKLLLSEAWKYAGWLVLVFVIGYLVIVYPVYSLFTANYPLQKQSADTEFILNSFADGPTPAGKLCAPTRCLADLNVWMSRHNTTRPFAEYMLGVLMVLQRASGGNTDYFLGHVSAVGSRLYFPVVYLLKEPLPVLILVLFAIFMSLWNILKQLGGGARRASKKLFDYIELNFAEFSMMAFVVLYWGYSMKSPLNIGFRHLLPTLPFIYMLAAGFWKKWVFNFNLPPSSSIWVALWQNIKLIFRSSLKYAFLVLLIVWFFAETIFAAPYFLSYFNEIGGGVWGGYRYVTDSNYDWGQDLLRLQAFVNEHHEIDKIAVDYFGGGSPKYYLGNKEADWQSSKGNPADSGIHWLAVSINTLQGATQPLANGQARNQEDEYGWLTALRPPASGLGNVPTPDYRAGTSIFIYKL